MAKKSVSLKNGDKVSFLDFEHGIREGAGGTPGKKRVIFSGRRRYTGEVVSIREERGHLYAVIKFDPGQQFDEAGELDGAHMSHDGTKEFLIQNHSFKLKQ